MRKMGCDYEQKITKAVKNEAFNDEIKMHLQACAECRNAARIVHFFQKNLAGEPQPKNLPSAGHIWWKSQLRGKIAANERAAEPVFIAQFGAAVILLIVAVWLLISITLTSPLLDAIEQLIYAMGVLIIPVMIGLLSLGSVGAVAVYLLSRFYAEE